VIRLGGIGELGNLATAYGALVLVKVTCLVVLGLLGWQQRRRVVGRMATEGPGRGLFLRFALTELLVMGVAVGFATALSRTPTPAQPGPLDTSA
jgi:putative copper export protein